jgi:hypothetical protein
MGFPHHRYVAVGWIGDGAENALKRFRNGHNLNLLVDRRCRTGGVLQLLLAQTDRLKAF